MDNWNYRSDVTDEIAIDMRKKGHFLDICVHFYSFIFLTVTANFLLLAVKWPKILVLAVMLSPPPIRHIAIRGNLKILVQFY